MIEGLCQKLLDPDEKVRLAAIQVLHLFKSDQVSLLSKKVFTEVALRCRDKKVI